MHSSIFVLLVLATVSFVAIEEHPLSDEFLNRINSLQNSWTAGRNFDKDTPISHIKSLGGSCGLQEQTTHEVGGAPETPTRKFRCPRTVARVQIHHEHYTGSGSLQFFLAVEAMSDRICIESNATKQILLSARDLISCCSRYGGGCDGGIPDRAWKYWVSDGIVSGGLYGSTDGCQAYPFPPCEHNTTGSRPACGDNQPTPECLKECDSSSNVEYQTDRHFGEYSYHLYNDEEYIKLEILNHGPVEASFNVYADFLSYKKGVYKKVYGEHLGVHAVKILGWGVENGEKYWLAANSWNENWGDEGYFKILRGVHECLIEENVIAGMPADT